MQSRLFLIAAALTLSTLLTVPAAMAAPKRPNVILILADDIGQECFGCYGSRQYRTPNIDRLAAGGMRFSHCYAQPLCTPTRVKLMTGKSNVRNYSAFSVLNSDQRTIGQFFHDAGYETLIAGKWQLLGSEDYLEQFRFKGSWPEQAGFERICLWQVNKRGLRYWEPLLYINGENHQFEKSAYGPDVAAQFVLDFLGERHERPFFVYYPMMLVHSPFLPPPDSNSKAGKNTQRNYEDMVAYMDKLIGRIVKKTEDVGIAENTLILFAGDNGTPTQICSQLHGVEIRGGKSKTTDAGIHVPLVAHQPGAVAGGRVCDDLVDMSDFLPTCLEAAEIAVPAGLDGRSFLPQLRGAPGNPRQALYCYYCPRPEKTPPTCFAHDTRWKLYGDGRFFDFENDVLEQHPLRDAKLTPEAAAAKQRLQAALDSMPPKGENLLKFVPNQRK